MDTLIYSHHIIPKVSVIIPIYKAEDYIRRCVVSLFNQSLEEMEYIFIDDESPDNSISIIEEIITEYPNRKDSCIILKNKVNLGVGESRQRGLDIAKGEYVIHCDPDDWVESTMYESMYLKALENNADMVICDFIIERIKTKTVVSQNLINFSSNHIIKELISGRIHGSLCNKLIRRELFSKFEIKFPSGLNICEDLMMCLSILKQNIIVSYIPVAFYHYDQYSNNNSLSSFNSTHNKVQLYKWEEALKHIFKTDNQNFRTGICFMAYWAFTHNVFSNNEYINFYGKYRYSFLFNKRSLKEKFITFFSTLGFKCPLFWLYKNIMYN